MTLDDMEWSFYRRGRRRGASPGKLPLTSMMDMLTIILIFLLLNLAPDYAVNHLANNLELPHAPRAEDAIGVHRIAISRTALELDDVAVATVENGQVTEAALALFESQLSAVFDPNATETQHVVLLADRGLPYETVDQVLKAAGRAGFPDFRFAIVEEEAS